MTKDLNNTEQLMQEILLAFQEGSVGRIDQLMRAAALTSLASGVESSRQYIGLLSALSDLAEVDSSEIGLPEARASYRKLVAVTERLMDSGLRGSSGG